ncbi:MAG: hypothetical protein IPG06_09450 [Haliea sp.]|nr:hypothetical protein [Haliea sp.]
MLRILPARAINVALQQSVGEIVCLMIDGSHPLTPRVRMVLASYAAFENPVVATRYFWLGPDTQNDLDYPRIQQECRGSAIAGYTGRKMGIGCMRSALHCALCRKYQLVEPHVRIELPVYEAIAIL